jgi:hypothetical protein
MTPRPYQQRVIDEKADLGEKIGELSDFINTNQTFMTLPKDERARMHIQLAAMRVYHQALDERIQAFSD